MVKSANEQKTILVPVDMSDNALHALCFAAELADCSDLQLIVLHVVHDPGEAPGYYARKAIKKGKKLLQRMEDIAAEMLEQFVSEAKKKCPKSKTLLDAELLLVVGLPVPRILEVAAERKPRMVVMGSQGRTGLSHLLIGSKAEQVVRLCPVPVTIVKKPGKAQ